MSIKRIGALVMAMGLLGALIPATALASSGSYWNVAGTYSVDVTWDQDPYPGTVYAETLILTQAGTGTITGTSLCCSLFTITSGSVVGDNISLTGAGSGLTLTMTGTIAADGSMSGTWATAPDGRTGTWATTSGAATFIGPGCSTFGATTAGLADSERPFGQLVSSVARGEPGGASWLIALEHGLYCAVRP